jgi:homoserine dehydrogenase
MSIKTYNLALLGFGNVGRGLAKLLIDKKSQLVFDTGIAIKITAISDMHLGFASDPEGLNIEEVLQLPNEKGAFSKLSNGQSEANNKAAIATDNVDIVAELTFTNPETGEPAISHCRLAGRHGKHLITTNKGPVALAGNSLKSNAESHKLAFNFEGSVMSGTPVLRLAREALAGATIASFRGILNGTANYILEQIELGTSFETAIKSAQDLGYAEADPTADIGGSDVFAKVRILSNELFGYQRKIASKNIVGIDCLNEQDIRAALKEKKRWKFIGEGRLDSSRQVHLDVKPLLLPLSDPLASLNGPLNGISFGTDVLGDVTIIGPSAGRTETAYALLSDILDIHRNSTPPKFDTI